MAKIKPEEMCPCGSGKAFSLCHGLKVIEEKTPVINQKIALAVIPEPDPDEKTVFEKSNEGTVFFINHGGPGIALECGQCAAPLAIGILPSQVQQIVLKCNQCGSYNQT